MREPHGGDRRRRLPVRVRVALGLLVLAALAPLRASLGHIAAYLEAPHGDDWITAHERHLAPVREALLALGVERSGYLPRTPIRSQTELQLRSDLHFLATRYALAPVMLYPNQCEAVVFADLAVEPAPGGAIPSDLDVVRRLDSGLVLLRCRAS